MLPLVSMVACFVKVQQNTDGLIPFQMVRIDQMRTLRGCMLFLEQNISIIIV